MGEGAETRRLTEQQARECEEARGKRCSCRCAGKAHGRGLKLEGGPPAGPLPRSYYENLPEDDPHWLASAERQEEERRREEHAAAALRQAAETARWHLWYFSCDYVGRELGTEECRGRGVEPGGEGRRVFVCEACGRVEVEEERAALRAA